jgi:hypothetical protein
MKLYHWSTQSDLKVIDPTFHGTGLRGAESKRKEQYPQYWIDRSYFGTNEYKPEMGLGPYKYVTNIDPKRLLNFSNPPENLAKRAYDDYGVYNPTKLEKIAKKAGYIGAYNPTVYPIVSLFIPVRVKRIK